MNNKHFHLVLCSIIVFLIGCQNKPKENNSAQFEKVKVEYDEQTSELILAILDNIKNNTPRFDLIIKSQGCYGKESIDKFIFLSSSDYIQIEGFNSQDTIKRWRKSNRMYSKNDFINLLISELENIPYDILPAGFRCSSKLIMADTIEFKTLKINRFINILI